MCSTAAWKPCFCLYLFLTGCTGLQLQTGRTGRTNNGVVYRLVPRKTYLSLLEQWEPPALTLLPLRGQTLGLLCAQSGLGADPRKLLARAMDPPDPQVRSCWGHGWHSGST